MASARLFVFALFVLVALSRPTGLFAQEYPLVPDRPGSWSAPDVRGATLPPEARAAAVALANQLFEIIRRVPAMAPAAGFQVVQHTYLSLENIDRSDNPQLPAFVSLQVTANLAPYERVGQSVEANERDTAGSITIAVNNFDYTGTTPMGDAWGDDQGAFIQDPEDPVDTKHGFPVYQEGNGDKWLLMRRSQVPVLVPATRERYLLAVTRQIQEGLSRAVERRGKLPAGVPAEIIATIDEMIGHEKTHLANLQQQYKSMSQSDRRAPAIVGSSSGEEPLTFVSAGDGAAIVSLNPALLDSKLPPAAAQAFSIRLLSNEDLFQGMADKLEQLDWNALNKLLH